MRAPLTHNQIRHLIAQSYNAESAAAVRAEAELLLAELPHDPPEVCARRRWLLEREVVAWSTARRR